MNPLSFFASVPGGGGGIPGFTSTNTQTPISGSQGGNTTSPQFNPNVAPVTPIQIPINFGGNASWLLLAMVLVAIYFIFGKH